MLTILLVNLRAEEVTKPLVLADFTPTEDAEVWRFDKEHQAEQVGTLHLEDKTEVTLPAESMTLLVVK